MKKPILYRIVRPLLVIWFNLTYHPVYINNNVIPKKGRVILAGTHVSTRDGFILGGATRRTVRYIAKKELFRGIGKWFFSSCGMIPVDRKVRDGNVLKEANKLLEQESLLGIFPEGTVNKTKELIMPFKKGAIKMAIETKSPIIPFAIVGKYNKKKNSIKIIFGDLYYPNTNDIDLENSILEEKVKQLILEARKKNELYK